MINQWREFYYLRKKLFPGDGIWDESLVGLRAFILILKVI